MGLPKYHYGSLKSSFKIWLETCHFSALLYFCKKNLLLISNARCSIDKLITGRISYYISCPGNNRHEKGLAVRGTRVTKLSVPRMSLRFLSHSKTSMGFWSHDYGQRKYFVRLLGISIKLAFSGFCRWNRKFRSYSSKIAPNLGWTILARQLPVLTGNESLNRKSEKSSELLTQNYIICNMYILCIYWKFQIASLNLKKWPPTCAGRSDGPWDGLWTCRSLVLRLFD